MLKFIPAYLLVINLFGIVALLSMQENDQPIVFATRLQEVRRRMHEKNAFKIKMRRMMPERRAHSRLGRLKIKKTKRRSQKSQRIFIQKVQNENLNPVRKPVIELPLELTLTAEQLRMIIMDNGLQIAIEQNKSPEFIRVELERIMENAFFDTRKGPFRVPHCYNYLSRILMQAKRLALTAEEREILRARLVASQLTQEEQAEIVSAFQAIIDRKSPRMHKGVWNQKVFDLAIDCDGKSLLERAYEAGNEKVINSVKSIQKSFLKPVVLFD